MSDGRLGGRVAVADVNAEDVGLTGARPTIAAQRGIGANRRGGVIAGVSRGSTGHKATGRQVSA